MSNIQKLREDDYIEDNDTDLEHGNVHDTKEAEKKINKNVTIVMTENRQDKKVNDEKINSNVAVEAKTELGDCTVIYTEGISTNEPVEIDMSEPQVETVNTEK